MAGSRTNVFSQFDEQEQAVTPGAEGNTFNQFDKMDETTTIMVNPFDPGRRKEIKIPLSVLHTIKKEEPGVDYKTGVQSWRFRVGFGIHDSPEEKAAYLDWSLGEGNWRVDQWGQYIAKPEGLKRIGQDAKGEVAIDEHLITGRDAADVTEEILIAVSETLSSAGLQNIGRKQIGEKGITALAKRLSKRLGASGIVGGTGASVKSLGELIEWYMETQRQTGGEINRQALQQLAAGFGGELFSRSLMSAGRFLAAPYKSRMTPARLQLADEAMAYEFRPKASRLTRSPIIARTEAIVDLIFGNPNAPHNDALLKREMARLRFVSGKRKMTAGETQEMVNTDIYGAKTLFMGEARVRSQAIDEMAGGSPFMSTETIRSRAKELLQELPRARAKQAEAGLADLGEDVLEQLDTLTAARAAEGTAEAAGRGPIKELSPQESYDYLLAIANKLPDKITLHQYQAVMNRIGEAIHQPGLVPGMGPGQLKALYRAGIEGYDDTVDKGLVSGEVNEALKDYRSWYKRNIVEFEDKVIQQLAKDPTEIRNMSPSYIVHLIAKKSEHGVRIDQIEATRRARFFMSFLDDKTKERVRRTLMEDITRKFIGKSNADPDVIVWTPEKLMDELNSYGKPLLREMFGSELSKELATFARVGMLMAGKPLLKQAGGLVAASIAARPIKNIGRLAMLKALSWAFTKPKVLKWLTTGVVSNNKREAAAAITKFNNFLSAALWAEGELAPIDTVRTTFGTPQGPETHGINP